jgi:hypothetical protein
MRNHTLNPVTNPASASDFKKTVDELFAKLSNRLLYQGLYAETAMQSCSGIDVQAEAQLSALIDSQSAATDVTVNLKDVVVLLIERLQSLEGSSNV